MINDILNEADSKMDKSVDSTREEFAAIRAGRANPSVFNKIVVDYYGSPTPLQSLATFTAPEARVIMIAPFDVNAEPMVVAVSVPAYDATKYHQVEALTVAVLPHGQGEPVDGDAVMKSKLLMATVPPAPEIGRAHV